MDIVKFEDFPEDERQAFFLVCKAVGQDPKDFHVSAKETPAQGLIPRQRVIVIVDKRNSKPIEIDRGLRADWADSFQREFKARAGPL